MLVLSRKESQRIRLGDSIVVTVVRVSGDKVRLGIEAPADMLVLRDELETRSMGEDSSEKAETTLALTIDAESLPVVSQQQVA